MNRKAELVTAIVFGVSVTLYVLFFYQGSTANYRLWYYVPAAFAAGAFVSERIKASKCGLVVDVPLAMICLSRPIFGWPDASGHAAFFVYALLTSRSLVTRVLAAILGAVTLYAKIWRWNWDATLVPGLFVGLVAAGLYYAVFALKARQK